MSAALTWCRLLAISAGCLFLLLTGCAPMLQANNACPSAVILRPLANTAVFGPAPERRPDNVAFYGLLHEAELKCEYTADAMHMMLDVVVVGERGPAATAGSVDFQYFVAVTGPDQSILGKRTFPVRIAFGTTANRAGVTDHIDQTLPLGGRRGTDLTIVLGFQQSQEVVNLYRHFRGRTSEPVGSTAPAATFETPTASATPSSAVTGTETETPKDEVRLELHGGVYAVPVVINRAVNIPFVLDSGAADVQLPAEVVLTLMRSGTLSEGDFIGASSYVLANGSTLRSPRFNIREMRVGGHVVRNVAASVGPAINSEALLGQSFLSKLPSWTLDNKRHVLVMRR